MLKINVLPGSNVWFTSDTHYDHKNICSATSEWSEDNESKGQRQFNSLEEMNTVLVNNINAVVLPDDTLFHLGDWSFNGFDNIRKFRERLTCKNIYIVLGNHDHHIERNKDNIQELFAGISIGNLELELNYRSLRNMGLNEKQRFFLNHYPVCSWKDMKRGVIHLFGHVHLSKGAKIMKGKAMDVGVDGNDYKPYSFFDVMRIMSLRHVSDISLPYDHHI